MSEQECEEVMDGAPPEDQDEEKKEAEPLLVKRHAKFFERVLNILPGSLSKLDSNR